MKTFISIAAFLLFSSSAFSAELISSSKSNGTTRCFWDTTGDGSWDTMTKTPSGMGKSSDDCKNSKNKPKNSKLIKSDIIYTAEEAAQQEKTKKVSQ